MLECLLGDGLGVCEPGPGGLDPRLRAALHVRLERRSLDDPALLVALRLELSGNELVQGN